MICSVVNNSAESPREYAIYRFVINGAKMCGINALAPAIFWNDSARIPSRSADFGSLTGRGFRRGWVLHSGGSLENWLNRPV